VVADRDADAALVPVALVLDAAHLVATPLRLAADRLEDKQGATQLRARDDEVCDAGRGPISIRPSIAYV